MSLFDVKVPPGEPAVQLHAAHTFTLRCRAWAAEELRRRNADSRPTTEWESYARFLDHTLRELEAGALDTWFTEGARGR